MRKKRNKNPLIKRILRELSGDWKKYLVVALFGPDDRLCYRYVCGKRQYAESGRGRKNKV